MEKAALDENLKARCPICNEELDWYQDHRSVIIKDKRYCQFIKKCKKCNKCFQYCIKYDMDDMGRFVVDESEIEIIKENKVREWEDECD